MHEVEFGEYLRKLRKRKKLTIKQIEEIAGVSNSYLSLVENGKRGIPSPDILKKLYELLDVPYEELMEKAGYLDVETKPTETDYDTTDLSVDQLMELLYSLPKDRREFYIQAMIGMIEKTKGRNQS